MLEFKFLLILYSSLLTNYPDGRAMWLFTDLDACMEVGEVINDMWKDSHSEPLTFECRFMVTEQEINHD